MQLSIYVNVDGRATVIQNSYSSRMRVMKNNWSATKQRLHLQSVGEISRHSKLTIFVSLRKSVH